MKKTFSIAIDGPAGAGKSTVAKALAKALDAMYLDTGAMYRAFGLAMLRLGVDTRDHDAVAAHLDDVNIDVNYVDGGQHIYLDGDDVTGAIRSPEVSDAASAISAVAEVRTRMVALQRQIAAGHNVVMDGRDIGTAVLPNATLKIYLTASAAERARRRCIEMEEKGTPQPYEQVLADIEARDYRDTHRAASPLRAAEDAVTVDSSDMNLTQVIETLLDLAQKAGIGKEMDN